MRSEKVQLIGLLSMSAVCVVIALLAAAGVIR